jgi:hypothetical protein
MLLKIRLRLSFEQGKHRKRQPDSMLDKALRAGSK